jgi:hypothetical protein
MKTVLSFLAWILGAGLAINEIRGLIMAGPVLYALWISGGTKTAIIVALSSLGGIALSVIVPLYAARRIKAYAR